MVIKLFACLFAPRLYRVYNQNFHGDVYSANIAEYVGDMTLSYLVPVGVIFSVVQRRFNYLYIMAVAFIVAYALRSAGRVLNPTYLKFLNVYQKTQKSLQTEDYEALRKFDYEFKYWPIRYKSHARVVESFFEREECSTSSIGWGMGWLIAHSFGIRLIYPGLLFGPIIRSSLEDSRAKFVIGLGGVRNKIESSIGVKVDTMFFDRRELNNERGRTLVICCEGNAGFYEIGILTTPLEMGYSVLGWNHPGFGGSSGTPYPYQELDSAEAVFDFAVRELGFDEKDIILHGWSIGGYPSSYLASQHPNVKGLILDATFDDILPLALPRMPEIMSSLVESTIRNHVNLEIANLVKKYDGPVRLIRRVDDEIIADPPGLLIANRGNHLLIEIMHHRYPELFENNPESDQDLTEWLSQPHDKNSKSNDTYKTPYDLSSLSNIEQAKVTIQIAENLLTDFKSTHCIPLSTTKFIHPWSDISKQPGQTIIG